MGSKRGDRAAFDGKGGLAGCHMGGMIEAQIIPFEFTQTFLFEFTCGAKHSSKIKYKIP